MLFPACRRRASVCLYSIPEVLDPDCRFFAIVVCSLLRFEARHDVKGEDWKKDSLHARSKLEIAPTDNRFSSSLPKSVQKAIGPRSLDLLDVANGYRIKHQLPVRGFFCDTSQSVRRSPWGPFRTSTVRTEMFNFASRQYVTPLQKLAVHGLPTESPWTPDELSHAGKWAGEGMFLPSIASVVLAFWLLDATPWWHQPAEG
jgi:hypothetical protein